MILRPSPRRTGLAAVAAMLLAARALAGPAGVPSQEEWADAKERAATGTGVELAYVRMGAEDGQPIVLVHGYSDNSRSWSLVAPHLPDRPLYAIDLRGHGKSDAPECCYGADTMAADIAGLMEALGIDRADVVGHSYGAITAGILAATRPDKVDQLALIGGGLSIPAGPGSWLWDNIRPLEAPIDPDGQFINDWYWSPTPVDPEFLEREKAEAVAMPMHVWQGVLEALAMLDWAPLAAAVEAPTLLIWADQDSLFDASSQERLQAAIPDARLETFAGLGHNLHWEDPEKVAAAIRDFLTE